MFKRIHYGEWDCTAFFLWNAIFKYLRSHFMSSLYMCFCYTNVRTNGVYELWVKNEYVSWGNHWTPFLLFLCWLLSVLDIICHLPKGQEQLLEHMVKCFLLRNACSFCIGSYQITFLQKGPNDIVTFLDLCLCTFCTCFQHIHFVLIFYFAVLHWHSSYYPFV